VEENEQAVDETSKTKSTRILNLSMGGMRLHTLAKLKVGSVFQTKLHSPRHGIIPLRGEVVWSRPKDKGEGYIVGIHFLPMDEEAMKALRGFMEESGTDNISL
jgi:c-di-GMP-binding flagellar brake protein YcgR